MNFTENITLQKYADSASKQFNESESRLSQIEGIFETRMNGKTRVGIIGSIIGTVCWFVASCIFFWYIRGYVDSASILICFVVALALIISLFIDEIISFSYYGKISSHKSNITQLKNRVNAGRSSIKSNQDTFMKSRVNGWHYPLSVGPSILEEAVSIESTINGIDSLKDGFINSLKNFLFFTFVIAITAVGSWALFGTVGEIVAGISGEYMDDDTLMMLCVIALLIVEVGEIIISKKLWSYTDCSVTNTTLWAAPLGPVLFVALAAIATLVIMLVIWVVSIVIAIAGVCIAGAIAFASTSGG